MEVEDYVIKDLFSSHCIIVLCQVLWGCYVTIFVVGNPSGVCRFEQHITTAVVGSGGSG